MPWHHPRGEAQRLRRDPRGPRAAARRGDRPQRRQRSRLRTALLGTGAEGGRRAQPPGEPPGEPPGTCSGTCGGGEVNDPGGSKWRVHHIEGEGG